MDQDLRKLSHSFEEFLCLICGMKFKSMNSMSHHVETTHQGAFICCQNHSCTLQLSHFCQSSRNGHNEVRDHNYHQSIISTTKNFARFDDKSTFSNIEKGQEKHKQQQKHRSALQAIKMKIISKQCGECLGCQRREKCFIIIGNK